MSSFESPWKQTPFVGREAEQKRLTAGRAFLEGNGERRRHLFLIEGVEGVGKSALARRFLDGLRRTGRTFTLQGGYDRDVRRAPLAPLLDAVDEWALDGFVRRRLQPLFTDPTYLPLLRRLPRLSESVGLDSGVAFMEETDPALLVSLTASLLIQVARNRPILISLEDIQWMPPEEARLLPLLNAGLRDAPVLVIVTLRHGESGTDAVRTVAEPLLFDRLHLEPLYPAGVAELIASLCGPRVGAVITRDVLRVSEGIPLRVLEAVWKLVDAGMLVSGSEATWALTDLFRPEILLDRPEPGDSVEGLPQRDRLLLLMLAAAEGSASCAELAAWEAALDHAGADSERDAERLTRLEAERVIAPTRADPTRRSFAAGGVAEKIRTGAGADERALVAGAIIASPALRRQVVCWCADVPLMQRVLEMLPPPESPERAEILDQLIDGAGGEVQVKKPQELYAMMLENVERFTPREQLRLHSTAIRHHYRAGDWDQALRSAGEIDRLTRSDTDCAELRALGCAHLASARYYQNRSTDVSDLLDEGEKALDLLSDADERESVELILLKIRIAGIPADRSAEAVEPARRALALAERTGREKDRYEMLAEIVARTARLRNESLRRWAGEEWLRAIRSAVAAPPPFLAVFRAIRAFYGMGDVFTAREVFETWSGLFAPVGTAEYLAQSELTALFAAGDGRPAIAAETARSAHDEFNRVRDASEVLGWEATYLDGMLLIRLVSSLVAAGHHAEALAVVEENRTSAETIGRLFPDVPKVMGLYGAWLRWRTLLPNDAPVSLSRTEGDTSGYDAPSVSPEVVESIETAAGEYRSYCRTVVPAASAPLRFLAEIRSAELEAASGHFQAAEGAMQRALEARRTAYSWASELEGSASSVTLRLRSAAHSGEPAEAGRALEEARILFDLLAERGLAERITELTGLYCREAAAVAEPRDPVRRFERLGSAAVVRARETLKNSRSEVRGPVERSRLFLMGSLRLMRPYSYLELSESAFEREASRTLLIALVADEILGRRSTREELAARVVPGVVVDARQKKAMYNGVSAARVACGSSESILAAGRGELALNIDTELEGAVWVDALEILRGVERGTLLEREGRNEAAFREYDRALTLARKGEFAADCYADWVDEPRDLLRRAVRTAALGIGGLALGSGAGTRGVDALGIQLTLDPTDEECHRMLIRLHAENGNRSAALRQYEKCRRIVEREFGVEPEPETRRLWEDLVKRPHATNVTS